MPAPIILTDEQQAQLRALWADAGVTADQISERLGVSRTVIRRFVRTEGLSKKTPAPAGRCWTAERTELIARLWQDGLSASQIAKKIGGVSRAAVIGRLHRQGISYRVTVSAPSRYVRQTRPARVPAAPRITRAPRAKTNNLAAVNAVRRSQGTDPIPAPVLIDASLAKPWLERAYGMCAYPIDGEGADTISCCQPTGGATYCSGHKALMFRPYDAKASKRHQAHIARRYAA